MPIKTRTQKTAINTFAGMLNRFGNIICSFALRTAFIYSLGIQYTGVSSVFTDILTMLSLSELGISTAIATALYSPLHDNDQLKIKKLMQFYRLAYRYIAGLIVLIGMILLPFLNNIISDVPDIKENIHVIFIFYIIKTAVSYLLIYKVTIIEADQKQYIVKGLETFCTFIRFAVEIICLIIFKEFMLYLIIEVVATFIQNIIVSKKAVKQYPYAFENTEEKLSRDEIKSLFKDIKGLAMYRVSASIGNSIDNILVSTFISTSLVGLLSNYTLIRKQIQTLILQFFNSVIPSIGNLAAERDSDKQSVVFNRLFYISFIIVNFCSTSLFVIINPFITFWLGKDYLLSIDISFIIAFDFFLYILLQAVASFRTANGLFVKGQYRPLITAILNIIFSVLLIKQYGIFGTIFATVVCRILTQWYDPYLLYREVFHKKFGEFYIKYWFYIVIFLICTVLTYSISNFFTVQSVFLDLIVKCIICSIVPNVLVCIFTFKTPEFKYVLNFIQTKIRR